MSDYAEMKRIESELEIGLGEETFADFVENMTYILNSFNNILKANNSGSLYLEQSRRES